MVAACGTVLLDLLNTGSKRNTQVAIVQISRITNRKGLIENLPQLAGGELGWAIDAQRLFIGNGTLEQGAPFIGNTEILTSAGDIVGIIKYTYKDEVVGYAAQTGPEPGEPIIRTVQAKLDDFADIRDFGAVGDGVTDDTEAINRAMYQLYCIEDNTQIRRSLFFPAGTYLVSDTIVIPPFAKLVGEGANSSIISFVPNQWDISLNYPADTLVVDSNNFYRSITFVDSTDSVDISDTAYWAPISQMYVAQYGDNFLETGLDAGNLPGSITPQNIEISSMRFGTTVTDLNTNIFLVNQAQQCYFDSVDFAGPLTVDDFNIGLGTSCINFLSTGSHICNQITFDKCLFTGTTYGFDTTEDTQSVTVSNSRFDTLFNGIQLDSDTSAGTQGFRAVHNMFDRIYAQGIIFRDVSLNVSAYNIFLDVGNGFTVIPATACVEFENDNNVSANDLFSRSDTDALEEPRILVNSIHPTTGGTQVQLGSYARENGRTKTLLNNQLVPQEILLTNTQYTKAFSLDYTIVRIINGNDTLVRHGRMMVAASGTDDSTEQIQYSDDYTETDVTGITLSATQTGNEVIVEYTSSNLGSNATLTYSLTHLA